MLLRYIIHELFPPFSIALFNAKPIIIEANEGDEDMYGECNMFQMCYLFISKVMMFTFFSCVILFIIELPFVRYRFFIILIIMK